MMIILKKTTALVLEEPLFGRVITKSEINVPNKMELLYIIFTLVPALETVLELTLPPMD